MDPTPPASASFARVTAPPPAFFFAGPSKTLLAAEAGEAVTGTLRDRARLLAAVEGVLHERGAAGLIVGAVPFAEDCPVRLFCPSEVTRSGPWSTADEAASSPGPVRKPVALHELDAIEARFTDNVAEAVRWIRSGALKKVVLARAKDVQLTRPPDFARLLRRLRARNPHGFTFALSLDQPAGDQATTLIGASPELLLSRRGLRVVSAPLAGSSPRSPDAREDRERAERLLRSVKDRHEHELVVACVLDVLSPFMRDLACEREPIVTATHSMWHLSTRIEGRLRRPVSSLELALALHPTPAICGTPTVDARSFITRFEGFDRGYFTGTLGHMDASGDGDWIVTIRCAELTGVRARLFAGAGIVESSVPELELAETEAKMQTMLGALCAADAA
jgi:isochorismate synthase